LCIGIGSLETFLEKNAKIVIPTGSDIVNIIGEMAGIMSDKRELPD